MTKQDTWIKDPILKWLVEILKERFGHSFQLESRDSFTTISLPNHGGFIQVSQSHAFYKNNTELKYHEWKSFKQEGWPSVLQKNSIPAPNQQALTFPLIFKIKSNYIIDYDIFGLTYWILTRQEEIGQTDLDEHGRFPATTSHAYKHNYLERPIVDEWLHILGQVIERTWPQIELKQHQFNIKVSHDVDAPSRYGYCSPKRFIRAVGADIVKRHAIKDVVFAPSIYFNTTDALHPKDPYNTFDWIMDVSEENGFTSAFYFICDGDAPQDADYRPEHPAIRKLMRQIHERGHEIGLHPSYNTYRKPQSIVSESQRLRRICAEEKINQDVWGGRMHFLRWEQPTTLYGWEQAEMNYDSSLGYADRPGFRCGTCFEYPAFDPVKQRMLNLRIRPLIAMECSIIAKRYMGCGHGEKALSTFLDLKKTCQKVKGSFTLLWHNSHLTTQQDKILYQKVIT